MESEFFLNARIPPPPPLQHFEANISSSVSSWLPLHSSTEMQANDCFPPNWEKSTDHSLHFESALSSLVSSPAASNSNVSNESFMMMELIGKLGNIGGDISPHSQTMLTASYGANTRNNSTNNSCYSTPLNSPPKVNLHGMDQFHKDSLNFPSLGKPPAAAGLNSTVAEFTADPGFTERAARFSCFGSRSFNGRSDRLGVNNAEVPYNGGSPLMGSGKMSRVSSSPSLKEIASQKGNKNSDRSELGNSSQEESTVSEQIPNGGEAGLRASNEMNSRKRKASSKGNAKEPPANAVKDAETNNDSDTKRSKPNEGKGNENSPSPGKAAEESKASGGDESQHKANSKPPEPPKDYIHVRARRGQATDSHSLAERVRREKISERMKLLQDLVPGCNKVTGKALMLDEIINYVQSLQRQVEFLSMKLASVNTRLNVNMDTLVSKDIFQSNHQLPHPIFPLDSSASAIFGHQPLHNPVLHSNISNGTVTPCCVDPLDDGLCQNPNLQLPQLDAYNPSVPQYSTFCEGDLQTIVQMGFGQNLNRETTLQSHSFHGSNQVSHMKIEM